MIHRSVVVAGRKAPMLLSLKRILEPEFEVAAMTDNLLSLLDTLDQLEPDMLVLDTGSAEFGTPDLAGRLHHRHPGLRIVLVGIDHEDPFADDLPPRTAYVSKHSADEALLPAARALLAQNGSSHPAGKPA
jgi:DNA-binding NarL/FixJ family response regulator